MPDRGVLVCSTLPLPPISGGRKRTLRLTEAMRRAGVTPHVLAVEATDDAIACAQDQGWIVERIGRPAPRHSRRLGQYARMEPEPWNGALAARVREASRQAAFVELEEIEQLQLIRAVPDDVPTVLSPYNVDSEVTRALGGRLSVLSRDALRLRVRALRMSAVERRAARRATATLCVSEHDRAVFQGLGARSTLLVPNGVDDDLFAVAEHEVAEERVLFFGAYWWSPNREGLERFLVAGWPAVRAARPRASLRVVGPGPLDVVRRAADGLAGVEVVGTVDAVVPELAAARLSVVPLWTGGGTRIKVLESMAAARPVVGTSVGVEHLGFRDGEHGFVADDPASLANRIVELLGDPVRSAAMGRQARRDVERFRWTRTTEPARELYAALREGRGVD